MKESDTSLQNGLIEPAAYGQQGTPALLPTDTNMYRDPALHCMGPSSKTVRGMRKPQMERKCSTIQIKSIDQVRLRSVTEICIISFDICQALWEYTSRRTDYVHAIEHRRFLTRMRQSQYFQDG